MLADGTSDEPLAVHVAALARRHGVELDIVVPDFARLHPPPGRTLESRLQRLLGLDDQFEVLIVHRDAEAHAPDSRLTEIGDACEVATVAWPRTAIVPVRMTEAWLLLDEPSIRLVAGKPSGTQSLALPRAAVVEDLPDPKAVLQRASETASELRGRRLREFKRDFPAHRRQLLERLDRNGPMRDLSAWQALEKSTLRGIQQLLDAR